MKEIKNLINNQTFIIDDPRNGYPVTPFVYVYKEKIQYDGSFDKLKLMILVGGDLQNKEIIGDTWVPRESMSTLKYFLADSAKQKARVRPLGFIGVFLKANFKHGFFVKL